MKRYLLIILMVAILFPSIAVSKEQVAKKKISSVAVVPYVAIAESKIKEFPQTVDYQQGENETREQAETAAKAKLRNQAMREAGEFVESESIVKDTTLEKDEITAISVAVIKLREPCKPIFNAEKYLIQMTCIVTVDTADMERRIQENSKDKRELRALKEQLIRLVSDSNTIIIESTTRNLEREVALDRSKQSRYAFLDNQIYKSNERQAAYLRNLDEIKKTEPVKGKSEVIGLQYREESDKLQAEHFLYQGIKSLMIANSDEIKNSIVYFQKAIERNPSLSAAYILRADAYLNLDLFDHAVADTNKAVELDPKNAYAYYIRGRVHYQQKEANNAVAAYAKAIQLEPNTSNFYVYRGLAYEENKNYPSAIDDYNEAINKNPENKNAYFFRGRVYFILRDKHTGCRSYVQAWGFKDIKEANTRYNSCMKASMLF